MKAADDCLYSGHDFVVRQFHDQLVSSYRRLIQHNSINTQNQKQESSKYSSVDVYRKCSLKKKTKFLHVTLPPVITSRDRTGWKCLDYFCSIRIFCRRLDPRHTEVKRSLLSITDSTRGLPHSRPRQCVTPMNLVRPVGMRTDLEKAMLYWGPRRRFFQKSSCQSAGF